MGYELNLNQPHHAVMKKAAVLAGVRCLQRYILWTCEVNSSWCWLMLAEGLYPILVTAF